MTEQENITSIDDLRNAVESTETYVKSVDAAIATIEATHLAIVPEVKETPATEIVAEATKTLFDKFKKPEESTKVILTEEEKTAAVERNNLKAKVVESEEYKQILSQVEQLKSEGELTKAEVQQYKETAIGKLFGKDLKEIDLKDFARKILGEDFSKLSDETLLTKSAEKKFSHLTGEDLQEAIKDELAAFEELKPYEQKQKRAEIAEMLEKAQPENDYLKALNELKESQKTSSIVEPDPEKYINRNTLQTELGDIRTTYEKFGESLIGQKYGEFTVAKEHVLATTELFDKAVKQYNMADAFENHFKAATYDAYGQAEYERGKADQKISDANASTGQTTGIIIPIEQKSGVENASQDDMRKAQ